MSNTTELTTDQESGAAVDRYGDPVKVSAAPSQIWAFNGKAYFPVPDSKQTLPAGTYKIEQTRMGIIFVPQNIMSDALIEVTDEDEPTAKLLSEIDEFFSEKNSSSYKKFNMMQRRGYILYGPPGTGKTCTIKRAMKSLIEKSQALVFTFDPSNMGALTTGVQMVREVEPDRPIVCIFEDLERILNYNQEQMLSYLDGEDTPNRVINIGTTNEFDDIPDKFKSRPRRFDRTIEISEISRPIRSEFFRLKIEESKKNLTEAEYTRAIGLVPAMTEASKKFTFAALAELFISVVIHEKPIHDAAGALKSMSGIVSV